MTTPLRSAPSGKLFGLNVGLSEYGDQVNWAVDPANGNDKAPGTLDSPLKTAAELGGRLSGQRFSKNTLITLLGDLPADDPLNVLPAQLDAGLTFELTGTLTPVGSGTIVSVTPNAVTGGSPWELETSGLDWTAISERRVQLDSGVVGWVGEVVDADNVRVSTFQGELDNDNVTPLATQSFSVDRPSTIPSMMLDVRTPLGNPFIFTHVAPPIRVRNLDFVGAPSTMSTWWGAQLFGCAVRESRTQSQCSIFRSCLRDIVHPQEFAVRDDSYLLIFDGGLVADFPASGASWIPGAATAWIRYRPWFYQTGCFVDNAVKMSVRSEGMFFEEWPFEAFNAFSAVQVQLGGVLAGSSSIGTAVGISVNGGVTGVGYLSAHKPTVSGAAGDTRIGGTVTAYGSIPFINAANQAALFAI